VPFVDEIKVPDIRGGELVETTTCTLFTAVNVLDSITMEPVVGLFTTVVEIGVSVLPVMLITPVDAFLMQSLAVPDEIVQLEI
jgi:hypothetical protein